MQQTSQRYIFHPATVLTVSVLAALIFAAGVVWFFDGASRWFLLYYFTPIGIPFVAFLFDRAERSAISSPAAWIMDLAVVLLSLTRALAPVPLISGHALFLSYALLTSRSKIARLTALAVLLQVIYLKILWRDATVIGGIVLGGLAAFLYWQARLARQKSALKTAD
jgi:hypothetical protein